MSLELQRDNLDREQTLKACLLFFLSFTLERAKLGGSFKERFATRVLALQSGGPCELDGGLLWHILNEAEHDCLRM